ncbi:MAG: hypothetical protein ACR2PL_10605 [Dehalococcoidia bacterium]
MIVECACHGTGWSGVQQANEKYREGETYRTIEHRRTLLEGSTYSTSELLATASSLVRPNAEREYF